MASTVTNEILSILMDRGFNESATRTRAASVFKVGISQTTAMASDTDLDHPIPIDNTDTVDDCDTADWTDSSDMTSSLNMVTFKEGTAGLNLTKDGTGSANASLSKTTTSIDFTSKELSLWIYIADTTTLNLLATSSCLTIRFGSDGSNYYQWVRDKADLAVGWNLLDDLTSSNADSTTGSPTITACDYTFVQLTTASAASTWLAGSVIMDDVKTISSDDYVKTFVAGYPIFDYVNKEITFQGELNATQANGYNINGFGLFNGDSPRLMSLISDQDSESKTESDKIIFTTKLGLTIV